MTFHISKFVKIALTTLTIFPLALVPNLTSVRAESPGSIGEIKNVTERIARNPLRPAPVESPADDTDAAASVARGKSMEYVKSGYEAQQAGNEELAIANYYTALKIDPTNGYAFLLVGGMLGNTEEGNDCVKAAIELFRAEGDRDGYLLAVGLLKEFYASN
jgi:tetratricopeptide (TPR) repeat protein